MNYNELVVKLAAVVSTLAETTNPGENVPASTIYLALGMELHTYESIVGVGTRAGLLNSSAYSVGVTEKGRELASRLEAKLA